MGVFQRSSSSVINAQVTALILTKLGPGVSSNIDDNLTQG